MKKISVVALVLVLSFALVGCLGVSEDNGIGKVAITVNDIVDDAGDSVDTEDVKVKIDGEDVAIGEVVNLQNGTYDAILLSGSQGKMFEGIQVERGETKFLGNEELNNAETVNFVTAQGDVTFEFDEEAYPFTATGDAHGDKEQELDLSGSIDEVYLVGSVTGWDTTDGKEMTKNSDGVYECTAEATAGEIYKYIVVDSDGNENWVVPEDTDSYIDDNNGNYNGEITFSRAVKASN